MECWRGKRGWGFDKKVIMQKNAIDFLKESTIYSSKEYEWIKPLIEEVLNDMLTETSIDSHIKTLFSFPDSFYCGVIGKASVSSSVQVVSQKTPLKITRIISIESIDNIGLLSLRTPLTFKDGLNVIYGKNAAGKSSLYFALRSALGLPSSICANLNDDKSEYACSIKVHSEPNGEMVLTCNPKPSNHISDVKIFDSQISTSLVENDQINQFEIAHLKSEYFTYLIQLFDRLASKLEAIKCQFANDEARMLDIIKKGFPEFDAIERNISQPFIDSIIFSEGDQEALKSINTQLDVLKKGNSGATIKNLISAISIIDSALNVIAIKQPENGEKKRSYSAIVNSETIKHLNQNITRLRELTAIYNAEGSDRLSTRLPNPEWLKNRFWADFIEKSLDFVQSLEINFQKEYKEDKCVYCGQDFTTENSKELVRAYWSLRDNTKSEIDKLKQKISSEIARLTDLCNAVLLLRSKWGTIRAEQDNVSVVICGNDFLDSFVENSQKILLDYQEGENEQLFLALPDYFQLIVDDVQYCRNGIQDSITLLEDGVKNIAKSISEIELRQQPLLHKKGLSDNKANLQSYLKSKTIIGAITNRLNSLSTLKRVTNTAQTRFSKDVPLEVFKEHLKHEYEILGFTPPAFWKINCNTSDTENRRVYSLADKKLKDVFSEAERRIHALADFFAESQINRFKGVFIFDDPVNSLDDERMEKVHHRLAKLVEAGNQVIVFTHNIVFMNYLIGFGNDKVTIMSKMENQIIIEPDVSLGKEADLKSTLKDIEKRLSEMENTKELQSDIYRIKNLYDIMSGYLESYVEFHLLKDVINRYRPNIRMNSLNKLVNFDSAQLKTIMQSYEETSRKCARHSQPDSAPQPSYADAKASFEIIKKLRPN